MHCFGLRMYLPTETEELNFNFSVLIFKTVLLELLKVSAEMEN